MGLAKLGSGQTHGGVPGNQLQAVPVSGGDQAGISPPLAGRCQSSQNIVGLPALTGNDAVAKACQQLLQNGKLPRKLRGHALAVGLIARVLLVPEGGGLPVKGDGHGVGLRFVQQPPEHGEKTVNAVGEFPVFGRKQLDAVKGTVQNAVAVQYQQLHKISSLSSGSSVFFRYSSSSKASKSARVESCPARRRSSAAPRRP